MQKPRRWCGLELDLLSVVLGVSSLAACSAPPHIANMPEAKPVAARGALAPAMATATPTPTPPLPADSETKPPSLAVPVPAPSPELPPQALPQGSLVLQVGDSFFAYYLLFWEFVLTGEPNS